MQNLSCKAVKTALLRDWKKAILINKTILEQNPNDIEAMNRLAHAYMQTNKVKEAKKIYNKVLTIDKYNIIAQKKLAKIKALPKKSKPLTKIPARDKALKKRVSPQTPISPSLFIEKSGKTKIVTLVNVAPVNVLLGISTGDKVMLSPKRRSIEIRDLNKTYLGALPDDIAFHLLPLIRAGNTYLAWVKNVTKNSLSIFISEEKRGKRFLHQPSFTISLSESKRTRGKKTTTHSKGK